MIGRPRLEPFINALQQFHVAGVVSPHDTPRLLVAVHTAEPQMDARVWEFPTDTERLAERVKPVAVKLEMPFG